MLIMMINLVGGEVWVAESWFKHFGGEREREREKFELLLLTGTEERRELIWRVCERSSFLQVTSVATRSDKSQSADSPAGKACCEDTGFGKKTKKWVPRRSLFVHS